MNDSIGMLPPNILNNRIKQDLPSFQVWVQCDITFPLKRLATAWVLLPERPTNGYDSSIYRRTDCIVDTCFYGYFRDLNTTEYYINPIAGFIGLKINIPESYSIGVTYETYEGKKYGEGKYDVALGQTMILKMIKCANQNPEVTPRAWELKMKNVYRLPYKDISQQNFNLGVKYYFNQTYNDYIPGIQTPLNQILLIDRYTDCNKIWKPDGKFDWCLDRTIIPETGDIIFPTLYPFKDELRKYVTDSNLVFDEIYSQRKSITQNSYKSNYYHIRGYADTLK